jgi:transposase-like protein
LRGASVAQVAHTHGINPNVVFGWRRLAQQGMLVLGSFRSAA